MFVEKVFSNWSKSKKKKPHKTDIIPSKAEKKQIFGKAIWILTKLDHFINKTKSYLVWRCEFVQGKRVKKCLKDNAQECMKGKLKMN